jgi:hypothetical protein
VSAGKENVLYIVDFGLAKEFADAEWYKGLGNLPLGGTRRYASIRKEQSWGDDLESLGYMVLCFARSLLLWQGLKTATDKEKTELVKVKKMARSGEEFCEGLLTDHFATYIDYTQSVGFEHKPDYGYLRKLFRRLFRSKGFEYDNVFDWTEKRLMSSVVEPTKGRLQLQQSRGSGDQGLADGGQHEMVQHLAGGAAKDHKGGLRQVSGKAESLWISPICQRVCPRRACSK